MNVLSVRDERGELARRTEQAGSLKISPQSRLVEIAIKTRIFRLHTCGLSDGAVCKPWFVKYVSQFTPAVCLPSDFYDLALYIVRNDIGV